MLQSKRNIKNFLLNFGPQHPAAHGVLRVVLELVGETILRAEPHIGMLHRGVEKLIESKTFIQALPYFDRLDYMAMMCQEHCYALGVEKLFKLSVPKSAQYLRVVLAELTRLLNHLVAITAHAMDVGALTPFLWCFEEREKMLEFFERLSGARMHVCFITPGGIVRDFDQHLNNDISQFLNQLDQRLDEVEELLTENRIWKQRLVDIGVVSTNEALSWGFSGAMLRASGFSWDLRKQNPYDAYNDLDFVIPVGAHGDSYDRYLVRMEEMRQSIYLIRQCLMYLTSCNLDYLDEQKGNMLESMEGIIKHFNQWGQGSVSNSNESYTIVEAPKGEFGCILIANNASKPARCHIKAPGFLHLQALDLMTAGHMLADTVTIIGSQDVVFGEIDR